MIRHQRATLFLFALLACAPVQAAITIPTVPVRNAGNANDSADGDSFTSGVQNYGGVDYAYNIGKYEVTNAQYAAFLNAVAVDDLYGLYSENMASNTRGGIVRDGSPGSFNYTIKAPALSGTYAYDNKPVVFVSWVDAARFANWLHNGQPTGAQDAGTTEDGAYALNGATDFTALINVARNPGAKWFLPTENEWYKAAYYDPSTGSYYQYPTGSNSVPNNNLPSADTGNSANYWDGGLTTGNVDYPLTDAGAYTLSASPYGTFDQGGNVMESTETRLSQAFPVYRVVRGGSSGTVSGALIVSSRNYLSEGPTGELEYVGFRVATVPEPTALALCLTGMLMLGLRRGRK